MAEDLIRYDILAQDALRGVVRKVLSEVARTGLPGEHHFYITFATHAPGVRVSSRLLADYAEDMTIVLQHQYWDLTVSETGFEVGLSFNGVPERLIVPFTAVKGFLDPSVQVGLQFEIPSDAQEADEAAPEPADDTSDEPLPSSDPDGTDAPAPSALEDEGGESADDDAPRVVSLDAFRKKQ
jgi:hypothetical protein